MLSYRHLYHAGNYADVFKHGLLTRLLASLNGKDKPWCYIDTHSGLGRYDLTHEWAEKVREYESGIVRLWRRDDIPESLRPYMDIVKGENSGVALRHYPGSPLVARRLARPGDRIVLSELNKTDHATLKSLFAGDGQVAVHLKDAYLALKAFTPPKEKRGLVLLDSGFDVAGEFSRIVRAVADAHAHWSTGMYAVWYPIMLAGPMRDFYRDVAKSGIRKVLRLELSVRRRDESGIVPGCGMLVVNPPWHFDDEAREMLDYLWRVLNIDGAGQPLVEWLVPE
jgi:23S rRNA (adenine2030-N6)-methyltransferase